jgi:hypothetical protein
MLHPIDVPQPEIAKSLLQLRHTGRIRIPGCMRFVVGACYASKREHQDCHRLKRLASIAFHHVVFQGDAEFRSFKITENEFDLSQDPLHYTIHIRI